MRSIRRLISRPRKAKYFSEANSAHLKSFDILKPILSFVSAPLSLKKHSELFYLQIKILYEFFNFIDFVWIQATHRFFTSTGVDALLI